VEWLDLQLKLLGYNKMSRRKKSPVSNLYLESQRVSFGRWVAETRIAPPLHLTQEQAAKEIGVRRPHLSRIENGKVSVPRETVERIAKALRCPKEIALTRAGFKVKVTTLDEKAYLTRILYSLKGDRLNHAINDLIYLYELINSRQRKRKVFRWGTTRSQVADAIYLMHQLPAWVRKEVLAHFNQVQEKTAEQDAAVSPTRKADAAKNIRSQINEIEKNIENGVNVCPTDFKPQEVAFGADVFIAVSIKTSGPMPPEYSILGIEACAVRSPKQSFQADLKPLNSNAVPEILAANGIVLEKVKEDGADPREATIRLVEWVKGIAGLGRPVYVGMTATIDWSFINWYTQKFAGSNPFGYGAIDIRTYTMAMERKSWGASNLIEERGESMFWQNQSSLRAYEIAQIFRETFRENTSRRP
jgi:transcriptional regulator with XRE-family HTH domain